MAGRNGTNGAPLIPYVRQSRAKERTISIDEQVRSIEAWAEREGAALTAPVVEQGVSGSKPWRERELGRAVEACEQGRASGIVVAFQDRLSRENGRATAEVWEALERAGARLVAASEGLDTAAGDQELLFSIKAAIAREQWKRYKKNWDDAKRNAVERGIHPTAHTPLGYTRDPGQPLVPDPETADAVRSLFRLRAHGASWNELCAHLESLGIRPQRAKRWSITGVRQIVQNRVYLGEAWMGEFVNKKAHEPLVTRAEWNAAQIHHPGRTVRGTEGSRLSGVVFCGSCGGRLTPEMPGWDDQTGKPTGPGRYRCRARMTNTDEPCPGPASANMRDLDALVVDVFLRRYEEDIGPFDDEPVTPELAPLSRNLQIAEDARDALIADPLSLAALPPDKRAELLKNAQAAVDEAQAKVDAIERTQATSVVNVWRLGEFFEPESFMEARIPDQRRLLKAGIERVVVQRGTEPLKKRVRVVWKKG